MKKTFLSLGVALAAAFVQAADNNEEGIFLKPGSGEGKIAFIDCQQRLAKENVDKVIAILNPQNEYNMVYEKASAGEPGKLKDAAKANLAIVITDEPGKPSTLVAVDDGWAVVNVAALDRSLKTEAAKKKFFEGRCRRQLLKVYGFAAGGASSMYNGNLCDPVRIEKLDLYKEVLPFDVIVKNDKFLTVLGVTKRKYASYTDACLEGWAPAPTNAVQKAIWDEVHAVPKNPIKIEFDPKKGR